jgi:ABC-2 type transport system permease protein
LWTPPDAPQQNEFGQQIPSFKRYSVVTEILRENYIVKKVSLVDGEVPVDVDVLFVIAPQEMSEIGLYAIDQYLMRGGSVIIAAGNYSIMLDQFTGALGLQPIVGGLHEMLSSYGIVVKQELTLDPQNEPFPVPVIRDLGGIQVREIQAVNYPFFVDIRPDGMDRASPILANMSALTLHWASPITWDEASNSDREVTVLLRSSNESWTTQNANVQPDLVLYPEYGFPVGSERESHILAVSVQGQFESYFADQASPLQSDNEDSGEEISQDPATIGTLDSSPANTQLVVIGSAEFLNDLVFDMSASLSGDRYLNSLQFAENMVGWSVEDVDLLSIRSRGISSRPLYPLSERGQVIWETANYIFVLLALASLGWTWRVSRRNEKPIELVQTLSE